MASIIVDLSDDIKKMQSLKKEIQQVKKELGSINVKVELDIKRDMEARLKALTGQYDALVQKVAQAEAKIAESTSRINKSAETIIKAQAQITKSASGQGASGGNSAATNAQTASVQAQAKAYDELANEIDAVMGTRAQNIKRMVEEQNAIRIINEELKRMQQLNQSGVYSASETRRIEQLNASLMQHKTALSELRQSLNNSFKLDSAAATSMNALSQSLARMRMTYRELTEEERNSPFGQELLASIQQADAKIKQLDASIGNHQRNVGNYASGWNGLNMSIQQIGRELPSLAMGWNTFFLAISNNLPILTDEIKRAKDEYNVLKAAGRQATPVWKQVVSSLLSWQTALTVGITLLTMYGDEIIKWAGNLFKARSSVESLDKQMQNINEKMKSNNAGYGENVVALRSLAEEWSKLENAAKKTKWIKDNQAEFNKLGISINDARDAEKAFVTYTDDIIEAFKLRAQAAAASSLAEEKYREALIKRNEADIESAKGPNASDRAKASFIQNMPTGGGIARMPQISSYEEDAKRAEEIRKKRIQGMYDEAEAAEKAGDSYFKLYEAKKQESDGKLKGLGLGNGLGNEQSISDIESYLNELSRLREENEDRQVELMEEGTEKQIAEINLRYNREIDEVKKLEDKLRKVQKGSLTDEQQGLFDSAYSGIKEKREKEYNDVISSQYTAEREAMRNYLQEYGTFQQQKLAIAQEYADKIAKAQSEGERMALEKRRDAAIAQVNTNALKMDIDWATAFSGLDGVFSEVIKPVLDKVKEYARTEEFRGLDASDQQSVIEAISRMEESVGGLGKVKFSDLGKQVDTLRQNVLDLNSAKEEEAEAVEKLKKAQEDYEKALKDGTQEQIDISKLALDDAQNKADAASKNVENQQNIVRNSSNQLNSTVTTLDAKLKNVTQGFQQLSSGGLSNLYQGITKLVKGFGGTAEKLGDVEFIGAIFSALDALKEGISPIVEDVIGNVFGVLNNTVSDIFSGDIFVSLFDSLRDGIGGFWDAITFGGFSSWTDGNAKEVNDTINRLTERNEALQGSIDALNDTIKQGRGTISVEASRQAYEYQKEQNRNYLDMARAQAGYHNSHHSWQYYMGWSQDWIDWIRENIDETFSGTDSLWSWTPEQMQMLKSNVEIWTAMQNAGKGGYGGRVTEKLDAYIEQAGKLEDITNDLYEGLTQISFDSMYSSFIDSLMDMKYDAEAAADDISEYFMRAMLSNKIGEMYYDKLEGWWKKFGESMEDNELSESERNALANEYMKYVNEALNLRDQLAAATGYDKIGEEAKEQQSATSKGFEAMTQDQASELSGRFTAVAESNYRIENATNQQTLAITQLSGSISVLASQIYGSYSIADDTRSILAQSYLELQQISENTGAIIVPIQKMQKDIERVKQNTERL